MGAARPRAGSALAGRGASASQQGAGLCSHNPCITGATYSRGSRDSERRGHLPKVTHSTPCAQGLELRTPDFKFSSSGMKRPSAVSPRCACASRPRMVSRHGLSQRKISSDNP